MNGKQTPILHDRTRIIDYKQTIAVADVIIYNWRHNGNDTRSGTGAAVLSSVVISVTIADIYALERRNRSYVPHVALSAANVMVSYLFPGVQAGVENHGDSRKGKAITQICRGQAVDVVFNDSYVPYFRMALLHTSDEETFNDVRVVQLTSLSMCSRSQ